MAKSCLPRKGVRGGEDAAGSLPRRRDTKSFGNQRNSWVHGKNECYSSLSRRNNRIIVSGSFSILSKVRNDGLFEKRTYSRIAGFLLLPLVSQLFCDCHRARSNPCGVRRGAGT